MVIINLNPSTAKEISLRPMLIIAKKKSRENRVKMVLKLDVTKNFFIINLI
jgi:hypothetical protein